MSLFDKYSFLHGLPQPGQIVTFVRPSKFCFFQNVMEDEKNLLIPGFKYTVRKVNLNSSSTYVYLEEFWVEGLDEYHNNQKFFNVSCFEWETPPLDPKKLIGFAALDYLHLNNDRYGHFGVEINSKMVKEGNPVLELTTSVKMVAPNRIVDAKFKK